MTARHLMPHIRIIKALEHGGTVPYHQLNYHLRGVYLRAQRSRWQDSGWDLVVDEHDMARLEPINTPDGARRRERAIRAQIHNVVELPSNTVPDEPTEEVVDETEEVPLTGIAAIEARASNLIPFAREAE